MATSVSVPVGIPVVGALVAWHRARQWARLRGNWKSFQMCGQEFEADARHQLSMGNYRAAVLSSRILLEATLADLNNGDEGPKHLPAMACQLAERGKIAKWQATRASGLYGRASRIVHGRACTRGRAVSLVREIFALVHAMLTDDAEGGAA